MAVKDWTFEGTWPYEPKWFDSADGRMHYVDEGPPDGRPVVMVHGNPTWGYLYRNFIGPLVGAGRIHRPLLAVRMPVTVGTNGLPPVGRRQAPL